jgi:hypothetical protein
MNENAKPVKMCACGQPLHYSDLELQQRVEKIVQEQGEEIKVVIGDRAWMVPRHYIALHGLSSVEVQYLGFREVTDAAV